MPGESAVRNNVASISTRALRSAFSMMSSVTGSTWAGAKSVVVVCRMRAGILVPSKEAKKFFFEKKNQKTFFSASLDSMDKSFLLLFSKKKAFLTLA